MTISKRVVPFALGCCATAPRCRLCNPPPRPPSPELIRALIANYRRDRWRDDRPFEVAFFGGALPSDAQLAAASPHPIRIRVAPHQLRSQDVERLKTLGVYAIELDVLSFHSAALKEAGRAYSGPYALSAIKKLSEMDVELGVNLVYGLPGTDHAVALEDARLAAPWVSTARISPLLVLDRSRLREAHMDGRYRPLSIGEAVTTGRALLDLFEAHDVRVIRVGTNPVVEELGRPVAGPSHSSLRELIEARRMLERLVALMNARRGEAVLIRCAPPDETRVRGPFNRHLRYLRATFGLRSIKVRTKRELTRGELLLQAHGEDDE